MKIPHFVILFCLSFFLCKIVFAQNDTNYTFLNSALPDSVKYQKFESRIKSITQKDPEYGMKYSRAALSYFSKINYQPGIAQSLLSIAGAFFYKGEPDSLRFYATKSLNIFLQLNNNIKISSAYKNIGLGYEMQANYEKAAINYFQSMNYAQKTTDQLSLGNSYASVTNVLMAQKKYSEAIKYNALALGIFSSIGYPAGLAGAYGTKGLLYFYMGQKGLSEKYYDSSLVMQDSCFAIASRNGIESQKLMSIINKGVVYSQTNQPQKAVDMNLIVMDIGTRENNFYAIALSGINLGIGYNALEKYTIALKYLQDGISLSEKNGFRDLRKEGYYAVSETYSKLSNESESRKYLLSFIALKDTILNEETQKNMNELQVLYESEKKDKELLKNQVDIKNREIDSAKKLFQRNIFIGCFIIMIAFAFFIFRGYRSKQKANVLIAAQKEKVEKQKDIIEEKNKGMMDSIKYAQRLQRAILVTLEEITKYLPENFLMYRAKDVVAGDFYFLEITDSHLFIAAADCTGHGVPGALVSVVCSNALTRSVKEFKLTDPAKILDKTKEIVIETFEKSGKDIKDGMDISLICWENWNGKSNQINLKWAGANNSLWYLQNRQLFEINADKQPIGKHDNPVPFTSHGLQLKKGDSVFLFTDGFPDQFGGPKGKKFKYKQLKELFIAMQNQSMDLQKEKLEQSFDEWKGNLEQVDDVCIIGIRF